MPEDPYAIYRPERIVTAGEVDLKKQPSEWKGWDRINFSFANDLPWKYRRSDYYKPPHIYVGRLIFWMDGEKHLHITVLRWDEEQKRHVFRGDFHHGYTARISLGMNTYCGS